MEIIEPQKTNQYLKVMADFTFKTKYAKYLKKKKRRENWGEAVDRSLNMHLRKFKDLPIEDIEKIKWAFSLVKDKKAITSMRGLQFAGPAVEAKNAKLYNCGVRHIDSLRAMSEFFFALLCGVGVTAGVSKFVISRLPHLAQKKDKTDAIITYTIEDSIEGWADSLEVLLMSYHKNTPFTGRKIIYDYSKIRKKGTLLKTSGGKAPGPEGLKNAHKNIKIILDRCIENLHLEKMRSIDIYDILMHCADAVLSGGIRRAATAIIFDPDDDDMILAKTNFPITSYKRFEQLESGYWEGTILINKHKYEVTVSDYEYQNDIKKNNVISWRHIEPQRARSNNSILFVRGKFTKKELKDVIEKTKQWGEPGFVFANHHLTLFNPCFEIGFIPVNDSGIFGFQFCNLTSINGSKIKTIEDWKAAAEAATIIGTLQASYTQFDYLSDAAKEITEEESLLGVSLTGWFDSPEILLNPENQYMISKLTHKINLEWSKKIGINPSARITAVKPEGTSAIVLESSSGVHPHHAFKYFRRIQMNKLDPVYNFFKMYNPHACEESVWSANKTDDVITFPIEVPENTIVKSNLTAIEHLNYIKQIQENWVNPGTTSFNKKDVTHNVSSTVQVKNDEWGKVVDYLYENQNNFSAVSLLSDYGDKDFVQAPMEKVLFEDTQKWNHLVDKWATIDYDKLIEDDDDTTIEQTVACAGGACEFDLPIEKKSN